MIRFTIRDLLWLTVVVALAVGWRVHSHPIGALGSADQAALKRVEELERILERHGYERLETPDGSLMVIKSLPSPTPMPSRRLVPPTRLKGRESPWEGDGAPPFPAPPTRVPFSMRSLD